MVMEIKVQYVNAFQEANHIPVIGKESKSNHQPLNTVFVSKINDIATRAYYKAEARGYEPGNEIQDWLDAEAEMVEEDKEAKSI